MSKRKNIEVETQKRSPKVRRTGYGRRVEPEEQHIIYKEIVNECLVYKCPFCDIETYDTDVKLRKHLRKDHPSKRTRIMTTVRHENEEEELQKPNIFSFLNDKENQMLGITVQGAKDANGAPIIVIAENPLVTSPQKPDTSRPSPQKPDIPPQPTFLESRPTRGRPLSAKGLALQQMLADCMEEDVDDPISVPDERESCSICFEKYDEGVNIVSRLEQNQMHSLVSSIKSIAVGFDKQSLVCERCELLASDIVRTQQQIRTLKDKLLAMTSRLLDFAQRGQSMMNEDIGRASFRDNITVKILEDSLLDPGTLNKNMSCVAQYSGRILTSSVDDDGTSPDSSDQPCDTVFCLTQSEWARGGLIVVKGVVHVPPNLIGAVALNTKHERYLLSSGLSEEFEKKHLCLDCGRDFRLLANLVDHSEMHNERRAIEVAAVNSSQDYDSLDNDFDCDSESPKKTYGYEEPNLKDFNESDQYKVQVRSFMHKEQFKDCADEVPTLDKPFQCKECNKTFERAHDLWGHHASFRAPAFKCNYQSCQEVFLRLPEFAVHYVAHGGVDLVIPESTADKKTLKIQCPLCPTVVPGLYKLQRHKMKHDPELKYKCPACPKQFVKANTLRMHINNVHRGNRNHKTCRLCSAVLVNDEALVNHMTTMHHNLKYVCTLCGEIFNSEDEVLSHKNQSHFGWNNTCLKCNVQFPKKSQFVAHVQAVSDNNGQCPNVKREPSVRSCPECEVTLDDSVSLLQHFSLSHPGQPQRFQCSDCAAGTGVKFLSLAGARRHYHQAHVNKSIICQLCKDSHNSEQELYTHLSAAHQDVVGVVGDENQGSVTCKQCSSTFTTHQERLEHIRYNHLPESIDIKTTDLEEVTMIGGHVIEYDATGQTIAALHTIP